MCLTDRYWVTALLSDQKNVSVDAVSSSIVQASVFTNMDLVNGAAEANFDMQFFAGPKDLSILEFDQGTIGGLEQTIDYGWLFFLTKPLFHLLRSLKYYCGSMAIALVLFTILTKLVFLPLTIRSQKAMKAMKTLQPHLKVLQEQYKDAPKVLQLRTLELYKMHKVNPLSGCLPIVLQIILFFPIYRVLNLLIDMRHSAFFGWISDLSAPDPTSWSNLFGLMPWNAISFLSFGLWPILMGVSFLLQQYDPNNKQMSVMLFIISVSMSVSIPVCVTIFWTLSNLFGILQNYITTETLSKMKNNFLLSRKA